MDQGMAARIWYQLKETKQKVFPQKGRSSRALAKLLEKCLASKKLFYREIRYRPGDQMPPYRNESSQQKTMAFKNEDAFVKENHSLSRERVTVFTQVSSTKDISLKPEFVFKGQGTRTNIDTTNVNYKWSPSGSYRLEHMLKTIKNLPNRFNPFTQKGFAIYVIDDYAVHLMPEIRKALYE